MSEMSKKARMAMRSKISRITKSDPKAKVDASDYSPPDLLDADVKTGARPLSRRQFKKGGKVVKMHGEMAKQHAGRKPRKSGGKALTADSYINRDVREANEEREGKKHVGAFKKGGMVKHDDVAEDKKLIKNVVKPSALKGHDAECRCAKCGGGSAMKRSGKDTGGGMSAGSSSSSSSSSSSQPFTPKSTDKELTQAQLDAIEEQRQKAMDANLQKGTDYAQKHKKRGGKAEVGHKMAGGSKGKGSDVSTGKFEGTRPTGGRLARKHGGKALKGATIIKIDINKDDKDEQKGLGALGAGLPMPPKPVMTPPAMPPGAGAPMPMPPAPPAGGPMPPIGRKAGGRVGHRSYTKVQDMDAGSGGGLGRLEKIKIYGKKA